MDVCPVDGVDGHPKLRKRWHFSCLLVAGTIYAWQIGSSEKGR